MRAAYMKNFWATHLDYRKVYDQKNHERGRARKRRYENNRRKTDLNFRIACALRGRLRSAILQGIKTGSAVRDLGCTIPELKLHLEKQFQPGMTWKNWGCKGWHIHHIKPLILFDLTDPEQLKQAVHYTNLQPLWARDNQSRDSRTRKPTGNRGMPSADNP